MQTNNQTFIVREPDKRLHQVCVNVTSFKEAKEIAEKLIEVTRKVDGAFKPWLGMAAPQIGFNKRVIILKKTPGDYTIMINPEIIKQRYTLPIFSRCFSLNGIYIINSPYWIEIKYQDLNGKYHQDIIKGGKAATFIQEINHINGILISDIGIRIL